MSALRQSNREQKFFRMRCFKNIQYYVPTLLFDARILPNKQRFMGRGGDAYNLQINPAPGYFTSQECDVNARQHLDKTNDALENLGTYSTSLAKKHLCEMGSQTEPELWPGCAGPPDVPPYDGNILMQCSRMEDFIRESTRHAGKCGQELKLVERDTHQGAGVKQVWTCPVCLKN